AAASRSSRPNANALTLALPAKRLGFVRGSNCARRQIGGRRGAAKKRCMEWSANAPSPLFGFAIRHELHVDRCEFLFEPAHRSACELLLVPQHLQESRSAAGTT